MKKIIGIMIILVLSLNINLKAENFGLLYQTEVFVDNNAFSLWDYIEDNYSDMPMNFDNEIYAFNNQKEKIVVEFLDGDYFIGYIKEYEVRVESNDETALFYVEEGEDMNYNQEEYQANLITLNQELEGIIFGGRVLADNKRKFNFYLTGKLLEGKHLDWRDYDGTISAIEDGEGYTCSGIKRRINSDLNDEMILCEEVFTSNGYSFGCQFNWQMNSKFKLSYRGENINSRINWNDVYTEAQPLDDIRLNYNISGSYKQDFFPYQDGELRWGTEDYITRLVPEHDIKLEGSLSEIGVFYYDLDYGRRFYPYFNYKLVYKDLIFRPGIFWPFYTLEINYKGINFKLKSKDLNIFNSSGLCADLRLSYQF